MILHVSSLIVVDDGPNALSSSVVTLLCESYCLIIPQFFVIDVQIKRVTKEWWILEANLFLWYASWQATGFWLLLKVPTRVNLVLRVNICIYVQGQFHKSWLKKKKIQTQRNFQNRFSLLLVLLSGYNSFQSFKKLSVDLYGAFMGTADW